VTGLTGTVTESGRNCAGEETAVDAAAEEIAIGRGEDLAIGIGTAADLTDDVALMREAQERRGPPSAV
jgi:hypothetical protein